MAISERDRLILALARRKLAGRSTHPEALRALREAVEQVIPAGRIYLLGTTELGPIIGSILSGIGIAPAISGVALVHVARDGRRRWLGRFA